MSTTNDWLLPSSLVKSDVVLSSVGEVGGASGVGKSSALLVTVIAVTLVGTLCRETVGRLGILKFDKLLNQAVKKLVVLVLSGTSGSVGVGIGSVGGGLVMGSSSSVCSDCWLCVPPRSTRTVLGYITGSGLVSMKLVTSDMRF